MTVLINRNDLKEFRCKFKGHYASVEDIEELVKNPKFPSETICEECGVDIQIAMDDEDPNYYIATEL